MKLYLIAGEASGDLHGSNLLHALMRLQPGLQCRAWGGDLMEAAGAQLVRHYRDLAFMGFWEVLKNLRTILRNLSFCKKDILDFQPDALVLIDYPGFNLRIARWAKKQGIPVIYYISPQIWAWHTSRVHQIRRDVDKMLVILPFEQDFYRQYGMDVTFVGHPLLDAIGDPPAETDRDPALIALLPGSRMQEVRRILPVMLSIVPEFPQYRFVVAGASTLPESFYRQHIGNTPNVTLRFGATYELLRTATAALVKSGTSTLEAALFLTPEVVCYTGNPISYAIAKQLVKVKYISLVNLIMDRELVRELIQHELNPFELKKSVEKILSEENKKELKDGFRALRTRLGDRGASERAARAILEFLSEGVEITRAKEQKR